MPTTSSIKLETATFASGCFWCTEAIFQRLKGVETVTSGYTGGQTENPTYQDVATRASGHAEAIQVKFDPSIISYEQLLDVFWHLHDPTSLNQQGADIGPEYRSAIFFHSETQKEIAEKSKKSLEESKVYAKPIVTEIVPASTFYPAEDYHQNFYNSNPNQGYCKIVIDPKIQKLYKNYSPLLKTVS
jgi:peptide-methionine (S)-S-oxide reductase